MCIIKQQMFDGSQNVTLQQINYEQSELESISGISQIIYEADYHYFNDFSFNQDHLLLSKINISPNMNKCHIAFYQNQQQDASNPNNIKIATVTSNGINHIKQPIKLPSNHSPLFLQVSSRQNKILRGQLSKDNGKSSVKLFDSNGKFKGNFNYHLEKRYKREEEIGPTIELIQENSLESKEFTEEMSSIKRQISIIKNDLKNLQSSPTLKTQILESLIPKKKYQQAYQHEQLSNQDSSDSHSLKSQIDYMGYSPNQQIQKKVSGYRLPLSKHPPSTQSKSINYDSIQKSMQKLGIIKNHKIEKILSRHKSQQYNEIKEEPHQQIQPQALPSSRHDFSSQVEETKPELVQFGIGTYTPIPSRQMNQRENSSKSIKRQAQLNKKRQNQSSNSIKGSQPTITNQPSQNSLQKKQDSARQNNKAQSTRQKPSKQGYLNSLQHQSSKQEESIIKNIGLSLQKQQQLSMRNKVYQFKLGQDKLSSRIRIQSRLKSEQSIRNKGEGRRQFKTSELQSQSQNQSGLYPEFDLCINNISLNFHSKSFGAKYLQLSINPTTYKTEQLSGKNLIWIGKSFFFKRVNGESQLLLTVKKLSSQNMEEILGEVRIKASDIVLNKKKSYFQTFLLSKKSVLATIIIGFQISYKSFLLQKQAYPLKIARQSQAQTQFSKSKTTKFKRKSPKKRQGEKRYIKQQKLPQAKVNPIRMRKYLGGKNIKIGRASRFINNQIGIPGPGDYQIESQFSRHAQKDY